MEARPLNRFGGKLQFPTSFQLKPQQEPNGLRENCWKWWWHRRSIVLFDWWICKGKILQNFASKSCKQRASTLRTMTELLAQNLLENSKRNLCRFTPPWTITLRGFLPQIFYITQLSLHLATNFAPEKNVELRMGHTMAARTDTQVDISESRPEILVVLSSQLLFTNLLLCVCRLKVLCMNPMRLTISWSVRTNVRFKSCPPGERTCPEKPQAPSSRC